MGRLALPYSGRACPLVPRKTIGSLKPKLMSFHARQYVIVHPQIFNPHNQNYEDIIKNKGK
jgi:hypothetical protein